MDRSTRRRSGSPPGPPSFLFFTLPRFLPFHAAESLIGLVWSNIFWVGLWDLVSSTVFPNDSPVAMSVLFFLGTAGLFFTNALYEESPEDSGTASAAVTHLTPPGSLPDDTAAELGARRASEVAAEEQRLSDTPFLPPRWEPRRLGERILSNVCSVFCWVGVWDQVRAPWAFLWGGKRCWHAHTAVDSGSRLTTTCCPMDAPTTPAAAVPVSASCALAPTTSFCL